MAVPFWKPTLVDTFALFKKFENGPQSRKTYNTDNCTQNKIGNKQCTHDARYANKQKHPPRACSEIKLRLDNNGVKDTNNQKGDKTY